MFGKKKRSRMRQALRVVTPAIVRELIEIALSDAAKVPRWLDSDDWVMPEFGQPLLCEPRAGTYPGRLRDESIQAFVESLPPRARAELRALMLLGRDTLATSASDFELTCGDVERAWDAPVYLQSKYGSLATHLAKALRLLEL